MNTDRIEKLRAYIKNDPGDPFPVYGLALEYKEANPEKAAPLFEKLLKEFPDYPATYYHAANLYWELEEWEKAEQVFEKGLEVCKAQNETKALQELQTAYQNFQFERD